jgi:hypothetical protein
MYTLVSSYGLLICPENEKDTSNYHKDDDEGTKN